MKPGKNKSFSEKLQSVLRYPEMIEAIADVLDYGVQKGYEDENWLKVDGSTMSKKENFDSKSHHGALHFSGKLTDESGLFHLAHEGTRALMELTRLKRNIIHPNDEININNRQKTWRAVDHDFPESWGCRNNKCKCVNSVPINCS